MRIRKRYLFYLVAFTSAIIAAGVSGLDAYVTQEIITDPWAFGFSVFLTGLVITLLMGLFFSIPFRGKSIGGRIIDPSFNRLRLVHKSEIKYHLFAGLGNAGLTIGYFYLLDMIGDPSIVLPFTQIAILYLVIVESFTEKNIPTLVEIQSAMIVTFGAILGSLSLSGSINGEALLIVFVIINPCWVLLSLYQRKLKMLKIKTLQNDAINIRFWNVVFSLGFTALIIWVFDLFNGTTHFGDGIIASITQFHWVSLVMIFTFFEFVLFIRALGLGKASVAQAVRASIIIFSIPVSLFLAFSGIIDPLSADPVMILIKIIGISLMILGLISFALTLVKAYIFIRIKPGYDIEKTLQQLWNIHGVNRVTVVAGSYDFVVKIHIRTLVKGYERIIRKIENVDAVESYKWFSVLKEWEDV